MLYRTCLPILPHWIIMIFVENKHSFLYSTKKGTGPQKLDSPMSKNWD